MDAEFSIKKECVIASVTCRNDTRMALSCLARNDNV